MLSFVVQNHQAQDSLKKKLITKMNHEALTKKISNKTGTISRPSGLRQPIIIPRTSLISGLHRSNIKR
jgi:hypothetical protein